MFPVAKLIGPLSLAVAFLEALSWMLLHLPLKF